MKKTIFSIIILVAVVVGVIFLINKNNQSNPSQEESGEESMENLSVVILQEGAGENMLVAGKTAVVHYTGTLIDGVVFDSSLTRGEPLEFTFGVGEVIAGWDKGLENMKIGEKRRLIIPPSYGYGDNKVGPIPPNSTLIFDVELVDIR